MEGAVGRGKEGGPLEARYANYLQIGYSDDEFVIEFGQSSYEREGDPVIHTRLATTPMFAREFLRLLERSVREFDRDRDSGRSDISG
jgi:hypothetical protein